MPRPFRLLGSLRLLLMAAVLLGCRDKPKPKAAPTWTPPAVVIDAGGYERYVDSPVLKPMSVERLTPGLGSPEAAVTHFYASLIRGDADYQKALPTTPEAALAAAVERHRRWTILRAQLKRRRTVSPTKAATEQPGLVEVEVFLETRSTGARDEGTHTLRLAQSGNRWQIVTLP